MGTLKDKALILGEGETEFYYLNSLRDMFKSVDIKPDRPKHTNLMELEKRIEESVQDYDYIFCVIDMDTKDDKAERVKYGELKKKYANPIVRPEKCCRVEFFETHRCSELFFLYYFDYTSRMYNDQNALIKDLNKRVKYEKKQSFFKKTKGLHSYFERKGGSLENAVKNSNCSIREKHETERDYTYSELGQLIMKLKKLNS